MSACHSSAARVNAAMVFSGARPDPPRCAMSRGAPARTEWSGAFVFSSLVPIETSNLEAIDPVDRNSVQPIQHEIDKTRSHFSFQREVWVGFGQKLEAARCQKQQNIFNNFGSRARRCW